MSERWRVLDAGGDGRPLLLLHGFTGRAEAWDGIAARLRGAGWRPLALDLPGHGETRLPAASPGWTIEGIVQRVDGLLEARGIGALPVIGYSMGGRVALAMAVCAPDRVSALVLESASAGIEEAGSRAERRAADDRLARSIGEGGIERFVAAWERLPLFASEREMPEPAREVRRALRLRCEPEGLAAALRGYGTGSQPSFHAELAGIRCPVLLLTGERDLRYMEIGDALERAIPGASRHTFPGVGHAVHFEDPDAWSGVVIPWLEEQAP